MLRLSPNHGTLQLPNDDGDDADDDADDADGAGDGDDDDDDDEGTCEAEKRFIEDSGQTCDGVWEQVGTTVGYHANKKNSGLPTSVMKMRKWSQGKTRKDRI